MRVAFLVAGGVDPGGVRVVPELLDLLEALTLVHDVHVVALRQSPSPGAWRVAGAEVWNVGPRPRRLRALLHLLREHRRRPFDVLVGYALVPQGALAALAAAVLGIPSVVAAPGGDFCALPDIGFGGWRDARGRLWVRLAAGTGAALIVPSAPAVEMARARGFAARRVPLPLSTRSWPVRRPRPATARRIAWVGSVNRVKHPELLVEVVALLHADGVPVAVDVVGEDLLGGALERHVDAAGIRHAFTFHGHLAQGGVRAVLEGASVLLVTSRFEGGCRVVLEAAATGVAVVGTPVGYVAEWAPTAAAAVEDPTPSALADAVRRLLENEDLRLEQARRAQGRLMEHDPGEVAMRWESLFTDALRGRRHG